MPTIEDTYRARHLNSAALDAAARRLIPGGISRDVLHTTPFPLYLTTGQGPIVHDVDGNEYVDLVMGNGALLLGHSHPTLIEAVNAQLSRGVHLGGCGEDEARWAGLVQSLLPSAERIRFTNSGSEATHLAARLARAFTGRNLILRFSGHFHGWYDGLAVGSNPSHRGPDSAGVPPELGLAYVVGDIDSPEALERLLAQGQIAAVILEPSGGKAGLFPLPDGFLGQLRTLTRQHGALLIFDEVVTGFRWAPGGAQSVLDVRPDLTALGKILGGGLPAGAVAGRADIMQLLAIRGDAAWDAEQRVHHGGTFSANPLAAAAGVATLTEIASGDPQQRASAAAAALRDRLGALWARLGLPGGVHGAASVFHVTFGDPRAGSLARIDTLRRALMNHGVLMRRFSGFTSSVHRDQDVDRIVRAFTLALEETMQDRTPKP